MPVQPTTKLIAQIIKSVAVTPSDTDTIATTAGVNYGPTRGLLVATAGNVVVVYPGGSTDTVYLAAGAWHPMNVIQVKATNTVATGIHAGW